LLTTPELHKVNFANNKSVLFIRQQFLDDLSKAFTVDTTTVGFQALQVIWGDLPQYRLKSKNFTKLLIACVKAGDGNFEY